MFPLPPRDKSVWFMYDGKTHYHLIKGKRHTQQTIGDRQQMQTRKQMELIKYFKKKNPMWLHYRNNDAIMVPPHLQLCRKIFSIFYSDLTIDAFTVSWNWQLSKNKNMIQIFLCWIRTTIALLIDWALSWRVWTQTLIYI